MQQRLPDAPSRVISGLDAVAYVIAWIVQRVVSLILVSLTTLVFAQVLFRYALTAPLTWADELSRFMLVWLVFLGAVLPFFDRSHFAIELFVERVPKPARRYLRLVNYSLILVFLSVMVWFGSQFTMLNMVQRSPALQIPFGPLYAAIPVAGVLMILVLLRDVARAILRFSDEDSFTQAVPE